MGRLWQYDIVGGAVRHKFQKISVLWQGGQPLRLHKGNQRAAP